MNRIDGTTAVVIPTAAALQPREAAPPPPILITEDEVLLGTAAAVGAPSKPSHWWSELTGVAHAAIQRMSLRSTPDGCRPPQHHPKHYAFLENARIAREMDRL